MPICSAQSLMLSVSALNWTVELCCMVLVVPQVTCLYSHVHSTLMCVVVTVDPTAMRAVVKLETTVEYGEWRMRHPVEASAIHTMLMSTVRQ